MCRNMTAKQKLTLNRMENNNLQNLCLIFIAFFHHISVHIQKDLLSLSTKYVVYMLQLFCYGNKIDTKKTTENACFYIIQRSTHRSFQIWMSHHFHERILFISKPLIFSWKFIVKNVILRNNIVFCDHRSLAEKKGKVSKTHDRLSFNFLVFKFYFVLFRSYLIIFSFSFKNFYT